MAPENSELFSPVEAIFVPSIPLITLFKKSLIIKPPRCKNLYSHNKNQDNNGECIFSKEFYHPLVQSPHVLLLIFHQLCQRHIRQKFHSSCIHLIKFVSELFNLT